MIKILDLVYPINPFDADKEKATGTSGVIVKAGQGGAVYNHKDVISECERVGLPWGIYWVSDARISPETHKRVFKNTFPDGYFGKLGAWVDVEKPLISMPDMVYRMLPYRYAKPVISFINGITEYSGKKPGVYTSPGAFNLILSGASVAERDFLGTLPLWTAQYNPHITRPNLYGSWATWRFWQFREGPDHSKFNGTDEKFYELIGAVEPVPAGYKFLQVINLGDSVQRMKEAQ